MMSGLFETFLASMPPVMAVDDIELFHLGDDARGIGHALDFFEKVGAVQGIGIDGSAILEVLAEAFGIRGAGVVGHG